jgi:hypothetical protein
MKEPFWRKLLLSVWEIWERFFAILHHIESIRPGGMFRLSKRRYGGHTVVLSDGTTISPGDPVGELHLSNRDTLRQQIICENRVKAGINARRELRRDLAVLARSVATRQDLAEVKAFYAVTMLYHGARVLGFEDHEFKANRMLRWLYTLGEGLLLAMYHPAGVSRLWQGRQDLTTKCIWMSRQKLLHDFLPKSKGGG